MPMPPRHRSSALPLARVRVPFAGLVGLLWAGLLLHPATAKAVERKIACVMEAKTNGTLTPEELAQFETAVNGALKEQQFDLVSKSERDTIIQGEAIQGCYKGKSVRSGSAGSSVRMR